MPRKSFAEYTEDEKCAYVERLEKKRQYHEGIHRLTLREMRKFYEIIQPDIEEQFIYQLELMRGNPDWEDPELFFPPWDEERAEEAFMSIKQREAYDPQLFRAVVWARNLRKKDNPSAWKLLRCMERKLFRILEILDKPEWHCLTLLAINVVGWHYHADQLIKQYEDGRCFS